MKLRDRMRRVLSRTPASAIPQTSGQSPSKPHRTDRSEKLDYSWLSKEPSPSHYNSNGSRYVTSAHASSQPGSKPFTFNRRSKRTAGEWPRIELYKEHEIPRPKYRGPVDRRHAAKLAAYSLSDASKERPRSMIEEISPTATRAYPSRRNSFNYDRYLASKSAEPWVSKARYSSGSEIESPPSLRHYVDHGRESDTSSSLTHYGMRDNVSSSTILTSDIDEDHHLHHQHPAFKHADTITSQPVVASHSTKPFDAGELDDALNAIRLNLTPQRL